MENKRKLFFDILKTAIGCIIFAVGFDLFLTPGGMNAGGITGLSMVISRFTGFKSVGTLTALINLPLFALAGLKVGKRFFFGSLFGMAVMSVAIDVCALLPVPETEPLIGALYGGVLCGFGLGCVFSTGFSTGGSDIVVRLLKLRWRDIPIGVINIVLDLAVAVLTGIVFNNIELTLYSGIAIFVSGRVVDVVVYQFDYSKVALIISSKYEEIVLAINNELERGATLLHGEGGYYHKETKVILTAVKRQHLTDLKEIVVKIDPDAFIIVQEAHQVLGEGFARYSKDSL